ncbi:hypothetical protein PAMA_015480 [Pampus argenteus]
MWAALLFSVRSSHADTGESVKTKQSCPLHNYCITIPEREVTAEAGLCVFIPCSFTTSYFFTPQDIIWYKCEPSNFRCEDSERIFNTDQNDINVQAGFKGRVSLLEPDVSKKNCSIIINDLTKSDSGSYRLRVESPNDGLSFNVDKTTISVTDLSQKPTVMIPPLAEGQQTTLTCTAPGLCSGSVPTITWTWRERGESNTQITGNITTETLTAVTQRHSSTVTFNPSAEHHGTDVTCKVSFTSGTTTEETVTLNVTHIKITGNKVVKEDDPLNLTCSAEGFSPSIITWTGPVSKKNPKETKTANLFIPNVKKKHSGRYICTAKHLQTNFTTYADVTVTLYPKIFNHSGCEKSSQSNVVTCVCSSRGFPLPTIKWPLLETHTEYSVITTVSKQTVNSTITLTATDHSNTVQCVSSNDFGEAKMNLTIKTANQEDQSTHVFKSILEPRVVIAFVIGLLLSATVSCLAVKVYRKKQSSGNTDEDVQMEIIQALPLMETGQAVGDGTHSQEAAEGGPEIAGQSAPDSDVDLKETEYSNIDFTVLKRKRPTENIEETPATEYAEINKEEIEKRRDNYGVGGGMFEGNEMAMIGEDKEIRQCMHADEEEQENAMYSNMNEILSSLRTV